MKFLKQFFNWLNQTSDELVVLSTGRFVTHMICDCGWYYEPSFENPWFGPKRCPKCGNYKGRPNYSFDFPDGWKLVTRRILVKGYKGRFFDSRQERVWQTLEESRNQQTNLNP